MTKPENKEKKPKIPYEPPRLFDLGGGVAHAAGPCKAGGSPTGQCKTGTLPQANQCKAGNVAGVHCRVGNLAQQHCNTGGLN